MSRYFCHLNPDVMELRSTVAESRPGLVRLAEMPFYPGGGGQLPDQGMLHWSEGAVAVAGFDSIDGRLWIRLAQPVELTGEVEAKVDPVFRQTMRELHTDLHIINALVFQAFDGALVTGVQMNADATARIDFDLPDADNDRLRALEPAINDAIRQDLPVRESYLPLDDAYDEKGLLRSRSVAPPPTSDGLIRVIEIAGLDRQACGGTHLASTGASRQLRILKIDNKGRHNRRLRLGLDPA
ncbi:MAG: alanyl-tRNA editing protein [Ferrovibrio sp.]|uniref:alanyl-tRNA editing protein n=1 Tax=Ferrovibrio sp. TaxID=1917215 RepID=UPI00261E9D99|nr:alanyl-tRNA editing protein [Ferrovibrio sp.]MCW0232529.1 alanyl-tRNA editing protein [Ferrovibrio sp.]